MSQNSSEWLEAPSEEGLWFVYEILWGSWWMYIADVNGELMKNVTNPRRPVTRLSTTLSKNHPERRFKRVVMPEPPK